MSYMRVKHTVDFDSIVVKEWSNMLWGSVIDSLKAYGLDINAKGRTNILSWMTVGDGVEIEAGTYTEYLSDGDKLNEIIRSARDEEGNIQDNSKIVEYFANNEEGVLAGAAYPKVPDVAMTVDQFVEHLIANYKTNTEKFMCRVVN